MQLLFNPANQFVTMSVNGVLGVEEFPPLADRLTS
jgi:hypothetical protein